MHKEKYRKPHVVLPEKIISDVKILTMWSKDILDARESDGTIDLDRVEKFLNFSRSVHDDLEEQLDDLKVIWKI